METLNKWSYLKYVIIWSISAFAYLNIVENPTHQVKDLSKLIKKTYRLSNSEGNVLSSKVHLLPDGSIVGYSHPNENRWALESGSLVFTNSSGLTTSVVTRIFTTPVGCLSMESNSGLILMEEDSVLSRVVFLIITAIVCIPPFLFFVSQIQKGWGIYNFALIVGMGAFLFHKEFALGIIFTHSAPSLLRLLFTSIASGFVIGSARGYGAQFTSTDKYLIVFFIFCACAFLFFQNSFWINMALGRHWFYALNGLYHGSLSLGSEQFLDAAVFKEKWYFPYGYGPVIFPLLFGAQIKFGAICVLTATVYHYRNLYSQLGNDPKHLGFITILIAVSLLPVVIMSSVYYPYGIIGSTFFTCLAVTAYLKSEFESDLQNVCMSGIFIVAASLFRIESLIVLVFILADKMLFGQRKKLLFLLSFFGAVSVFLYGLQNYLKFGDALQAGIGYNSMVNNTNFHPVSLSFLPQNLKGYFIDLPTLSDWSTGFLKFGFHGSEPGGYFILKYPSIVLGLFTLCLSNRFIRFSRSEFTLVSRGKLICGASGFALFFFYLLAFNTSPKYEMLYIPLIMVSGVCYCSRSTLVNVFVLITVIWMQTAVMLNYIKAYSWQV